MPARDRIVDAAAELVRDGAPLTVTAVAHRAGVSRSTVYRHFPRAGGLAEVLIASGRAAPDRLGSVDATDRILDAVGTLLGRSGLSAMTIEEVARVAGVSPVTVYRRFCDRRGLLEAFVRQRTPRRLAADLPYVATGDVEEDLRRIARAGISFLAHHRGVFVLAFAADEEAAALFADVRQGSVSMREATERYVTAALPGAGPAEAHAFLGMVLALGLGAGAEEVEARSELAVSIFLRGVRG